MVHNFTIQEFDPDHTRLLGEGLWGRVYDLGDGTVLKIAKEHCAGIGSGRDKIAREYQALKALAAIPDIAPLTAKALGYGDIPQTSPLARQGYDLWLHTTKKDGKRLDIEDVERMSAREQETLGHNIGQALATLHLAMEGHSALSRRIDNPYQELHDLKNEHPDYAPYIDTLDQEFANIPPDIRQKPRHKDFNITNLLFSEHNTVCAILDFAEQGTFYPEKDIADITNECPALERSLISAYEGETGYTVSKRRMILGLGENALYGAIISARKGDHAGGKEERNDLVKYIALLAKP